MSTLRMAQIVALATLFIVIETASASVLSLGAPTTTVPDTLYDPLGSLSSPLPAGQILLPVEVLDASGLQDWSFDLLFDSVVVNPVDGGGFYVSIYQAEFSVADPTLSNITSSGLLLGSALSGIAGFSSGVTGDGLLVFVLFAFEPDQQNNDPLFSVTNVTLQQQVPEPTPLLLVLIAILALLPTLGRRTVVR